MLPKNNIVHLVKSIILCWNRAEFCTFVVIVFCFIFTLDIVFFLNSVLTSCKIVQQLTAFMWYFVFFLFTLSF